MKFHEISRREISDFDFSTPIWKTKFGIIFGDPGFRIQSEATAPLPGREV